MKSNLSFILILIFSFQSLAQTSDMDMPDLSEEEAMSLPWFGNESFIQNGINAHTVALSSGRGLSLDAKFYIPVRLVIYRDNAGSIASAISETDAIESFELANDIFFNANTGIKFFLHSVSIVKDDDYRLNVHDFESTVELFANNKLRGVLNVHFVKNAWKSGYAINPYFPSVPFTTYSNFVRTHNGNDLRDVDNIASTLAHEMGHNFGLLHTHHPGRLISLAFNEDNATIGNDCLQEFVSRTEENNFFNGCFTTGGEKKCNVNGDFLCDTQADPSISNNGDRWVNSDCNEYTYPGGGNYAYDNDGKRWIPPVRNVMSYTSRACRSEFSWGQRVIMWHYIENDFYHDFNPKFEGPELVCASDASDFSVSLPSDINVQWTVSDNLRMLSSSNEHNVSVIVRNSMFADQDGWVNVEITFPTGSSVEVRSSVKMGRPNGTKISFNRTATYNFQNNRWNMLAANYAGIGLDFEGYTWEWMVPGSMIQHNSPTDPYINFRPTLNGPNSIYVKARATNECGTSDWYGQWFNVTGGGSIPCNDNSNLPCRDDQIHY